MNQNHCPDCGGDLVLDQDGALTCCTIVNGSEFSCGWRGDPILELAPRHEQDP